MWGDLGKPTHTLVPCWMLKPLPSRNQCTICFALVLNPCLQGTSVWVGLPQPMQGKPRKILGSSTLPECTRSCHNYYTLITVQSFDPLQARGLVYNICSQLLQYKVKNHSHWQARIMMIAAVSHRVT